MELAKALLEVMKVSSSKGKMDKWSLSLCVGGTAASSRVSASPKNQDLLSFPSPFKSGRDARILTVPALW